VSGIWFWPYSDIPAVLLVRFKPNHAVRVIQVSRKMVKKMIPDTVFAVSGLLGSPPVLLVQKLTEMSRHGSLSFPFHFLREAFVAARLRRCPHKLVTALAHSSDHNFALRSDNFLDWLQMGLVSGHGCLRLIQRPTKLQL
jgi:hypothetical protein